MFHIVLLEPEIPANTGNIGRTCLVTGSRLHLIEPLGFRLNDKYLKRAGMDYWNELDVTVYDSWRDFVEKNKEQVAIFGASYGARNIDEEKTLTDNAAVTDDAEACMGEQNHAERKKTGSAAEPLQTKNRIRKKANLWMATTKAKRTHDAAAFQDGDYILFGKESAGIPEEILMENETTCIRIPMADGQRSLNLSNSVAVVLYEALRQNNYLNLETKGQLHNHIW